MSEQFQTGQCNVTVVLPIQYRSIRHGKAHTVFDIRVAGTSSVFEFLPADAKVSILQQVADHDNAQSPAVL